MTGSRALPLLTTAWPLQTFLACILLSAGSAAQSSASTPDKLPSAPTGAEATAPDDTRVVIPAGTSIPLVLTRYINSNDVRAGDSVFAQVSTPVMVGDQVAIPAGTFVQGKAEKLTRNGTRAEMTMHSAALVMGSSVIDLGGPVTIESENWTAYNNPEGHKKAAIILAPLLGSGLGMAIGAALDKPHTVIMGGRNYAGIWPGRFAGSAGSRADVDLHPKQPQGPVHRQRCRQCHRISDVLYPDGTQPRVLSGGRVASARHAVECGLSNSLANCRGIA